MDEVRIARGTPAPFSETPRGGIDVDVVLQAKWKSVDNGTKWSMISCSARSDAAGAKAERPRRSAAVGKPATMITRAARRETFARDGEQCTYESEAGERCASRSFLELNHATARARGGSSDPSNLRVFCRAHNRLHAELDLVKVHVEQQIRRRRRTNESAIASAQPTVGQHEYPDEH